jgi:hypothetical protein
VDLLLFSWIKLICNLPPLKSLKGDALYPKKLMMHEGDAKIIMLNEYDDTKAFYMDLETGKVVDEFVRLIFNTVSNL